MNRLVVGLGLGLAITAIIPARAATTLNITGEVAGSTCTTDFKGGSATIVMGKLDLKELQDNDRIGGRTLDVTLTCATASPTDKQIVSVQFVGNSNQDGSLRSESTGVAYRIYDANDNKLDINTAPINYVTIASASPVTLRHTVWMAKGSGTAAPGKANATAQMNIVYK